MFSKLSGMKISYGQELEDFKHYLRSDSNEDAKRPLLYPLFRKLTRERFGNEDKFKIESGAHGADVYVEGLLIVESKTDFSQWLEGFYQALHYQKRFGLAYSAVCVIARQFVGIWKVNQLAEFAVLLANTADARKAPSETGRDDNPLCPANPESFWATVLDKQYCERAAAGEAIGRKSKGTVPALEPQLLQRPVAAAREAARIAVFPVFYYLSGLSYAVFRLNPDPQVRRKRRQTQFAARFFGNFGGD